MLARTTRVRVGHLVLCNNFRHPALLAKMASTLDVLSAGRLELGIGSGSVGVEHEQTGLPWGTFGRALGASRGVARDPDPHVRRLSPRHSPAPTTR